MAVHHSYLPYCRRFLLFYLLVMAIVSFAKKVILLVESDHLRHISLQDQPLFSPLYSILIDCCVGCTPIPPQYLAGPPFPTYILHPPKNHLFCMVVASWHIIAAILYISSNTTIRDCLYDSCLCTIVRGELLILSNNGIIIIVM